MFTLKNAIKNIYRYKSRYFLFGILYFLTICVAAITTSVFFHSIDVIEAMNKEYRSTVKILHTTVEDVNSSRWISKDDYMEYKTSDYVEDVKISRYNFCTTFLSYDLQNLQIHSILKDYSGTTDEQTRIEVATPFDESEMELELYTSEGIQKLNYLLHQPIFILGYDLSLPHFSDTDLEISEGRMFEKDDECVISKNSKHFEENWNKLNVGDTIVFKNTNGIYKKYTVVGILKEDVRNDINTNQRMIHTTLKSAEGFDSLIIESQKKMTNFQIFASDLSETLKIGYEAIIYLKSYENFDDFSKEVSLASIGKYSGYVRPAFENFFTISQFIINMQIWSIFFTIIIGFIIISITILITLIFLNNRKYEIAVLRSVGMKKSKLILNYLIENLTFIWSITFVAFIAAQPIFKVFIMDKIKISVAISGTSTQTIALFRNILAIFTGMTGVVMLSLILACVNIIRFEPLKIFNKQY